MNLRIWIESEPLSADAPETTTYLDIDIRGDWTVHEARALAISFAQQAHAWLARNAEKDVVRAD